MSSAVGEAARVLVARNAVSVTFILNGFVFASWISRLPEVRERLQLSNGQLGAVLLVIAVGSLTSLPTTGWVIERRGAAFVMRVGAVAAILGLSAAVELPLVVHLVAAGGMGVVAAWWSSNRFLPSRLEQEPEVVAAPSAAAGAQQTPPRSAWLEPRTVMIGMLVCSLAIAEGTANDWLAIALIDGYDARHWVGVLGFGLFVSAMTTGRMLGPALLDRWGRVPVLWATMAAAGSGVLLIVWGGHPAVAAMGIVIWGLGASLGFPVGMSAAADEEDRAPARVSVVSTIAYTAFLAGPPLLGFVGDRVGSLNALLVVALLLVPCALLVPATRKPV